MTPPPQAPEALAAACRAFFDLAQHQLLVRFDGQGRVLEGNRAFLKAAGLGDQPLGKSIDRFLSQAGGEAFLFHPRAVGEPPCFQFLRVGAEPALFRCSIFRMGEEFVLLGEGMGSGEGPLAEGVSSLSAEMNRLLRDMKHKQETLAEDLRAAAFIQKCLMPRSLPPSRDLAVAWRFQPCSNVGGDLCHVFPLDETHLGAFILDVAGHGVRAAMLTVAISQSLQAGAGVIYDGPPENRHYRQPGEVLTLLDREFAFDRFETYFTIVYLVIDRPSGRVRLASAGHPHPLVVSAGEGIRTLPGTGPVIGFGAVAAEEEEEVRLVPGDRLVLFTDGVTERRNPQGAFFGLKGLCDVLEEERSASLSATVDAIISRLAGFGHPAPYEDDVTLLAMEYHGPQGADLLAPDLAAASCIPEKFTPSMQSEVS